MRIAIFSDLHLEFGEFTFPTVDADVIVIAGDLHADDIAPRRRAGILGFVNVLRGFRAANPDADIVAVMGNHDPWYHDLSTIVDAWRAALVDDPRIHFLYRDTIKIAGRPFVGATLWTDLSDPNIRRTAELVMRDYAKILVRGKPLTGDLVHRAHRADLRAITSAMELYGSDLVVVTHHAPSRRSHSHYPDAEDAEHFYSNELDALILQHRPALWLHGHTHVRHDYMIGTTRVVTNPRGYMRYPSADAFMGSGVIVELP